MSKAKDSLVEVDASGAFKRTDSAMRDWIRADGSTDFPAAAGRYHLYVSYACPWACRCLAVRSLKGLEDIVSVSIVAPAWEATKPEVDEHRGWVFKDESEEQAVIPDPIFGAKTVRELYEQTGSPQTKFTVPVLFDTETKRIVNNESAEIVRMFNSEFNALLDPSHAAIDLYPEALRDAIDAVNEWVYPAINNGVYRCGFAQKQEPYDKAVTELFDALDRVEAILATSRYICGSSLTEADIRLFVTLVRFDEVYTVHFKCNKKMLREYEHIPNYIRDVYQLGNIRDSVNMYHIKKHYYCSHPTINRYGIIPVGHPFDLDAPHGREKF